jgi:glucose/mannose transport system substrate-binding protein
MKKPVVSVLVLAFILSITGITIAAGKVEIFSWWTGGGEAQGLKALITQFEKSNPGIKLINATVAGGAGSNSQAVLKTRMVGGNPPDSFQVHGGAELIDTYAKNGSLEPITKLVDLRKFNKQIISINSYKGKVYAVPVNVHRGNVIFGNSAILKKHRLKMPASMPEFIRTCRKLQKAGVDALALGDTDKWAATQLFENTLAAMLGSKKYNGLWNGKTAFTDPGVKKALTQFVEITKYINADHSALGWQDAAAKVHDGKAAFTVMGDWAEGYFKSVGWAPDKEFTYAPFPGTSGSFMMINDSFCLPKRAPHRKSAIAWLKTVASLKGQDAFNPLKGSIPARLDADKKLYDSYLQSAMTDFSKNVLMPSIVHGSAAPGGFTSTLSDAINILIADKNITKAAAAIRKAAREYLK